MRTAVFAGATAAVGAAFYRLGEIHRLRGEFQKAEEAYRQANQYGRKPQPGLALLRLAQGRIDIAASSIRSALAETEQRRTRARLLPVAVEIMVAAEDLETARTAETELCEIARTLGTPFLSAASAHVTGAVLLASGHAAEAMVSSAPRLGILARARNAVRARRRRAC